MKDAKKWIRIIVEDKGFGVDSDKGEYLFNPFFTAKGRTAGTGLGLSINHGELSFESEYGKYTKFYMGLPVDNGWNLVK